MKSKETEKKVVAKPVALRPCSDFKFFTELLDARDSTSSRSPWMLNILNSSVKSQDDIASLTESETKVETSEIYKPKPMVVPRKMGNSNVGYQDVPADIQAKNYKLAPVRSLSGGVIRSHQTCYDGFNWRKYGQKQVKGSEYPRSYYKCTHPRCPVKKNVETLHDGRIAEIVYKGEHNHPKPQNLRRMQSSSNGQNSTADRGITRDSINPAINTMSTEEDSRNDHLNDDGVIKKRKRQNGSSNDGRDLQGIPGGSMVLQASGETRMHADGFRWHEYDQKIFEENSTLSSRYRRANLGFDARKHVERATDDPEFYITRYKGRHNNDIQDNERMHSTASKPNCN